MKRLQYRKFWYTDISKTEIEIIYYMKFESFIVVLKLENNETRFLKWFGKRIQNRWAEVVSELY